MVPVSLLVVAMLGRPAMASPVTGLIAAGALFVLSGWLFVRNVRRFRREELLTRWR